ncbi:NfeD family protein [Geodermatophilus sp. YIM 151500]|uniref:NfeD family protein n=1 Tax=Geodermatophilus sp. YIM 151500 TaxID=2984531 RepID=UPI0021E416ED|nr:NfeD family protein [Geodermatophilus sp. YIM 151500]MCV2491855.1 NfeD family protein [Geodermatophilus sp. YIM 151500]
MAAAFLALGALGMLVLLVSLFVGEISHVDLGGTDADGPFSIPAMAALLGGVGFGGAAATALLPGTLSDGAALAAAAGVGLAVAVPLAWAAVRLSRALRDMPTQETLTRHHLIGAQGIVVSPVPSPGLGEVRLTLAGQQMKFAARSDLPLPSGTPVYVVETLSETCVQVVSTALDPLLEPGGDS